MNKFVSVIIPTYNRANLILETIDSIKNQTYRNFEIIIADDGSDDNTAEIISGLKDERIFYYQLPHTTIPSIARNYAIKKSKGDYIAFLDSDDLWMPEKLEKQVEILDNNDNVGLVYCNASYFGTAHTNGTTILKKGYSGYVFDKLIEVNFVPLLSVMCRRNVFEVAGYFDETMNIRAVEDYELWLRIAKFFDFYYIDEALCRYRLHSENILGGDKLMSSYKAFQAFITVCNKIKINNHQKKKGMAANYFYVAMAYLSRNKLERFKYYLLRSIKEKPGLLNLFLLVCLYIFKSHLYSIYGFWNRHKPI